MWIKEELDKINREVRLGKLEFTMEYPEHEDTPALRRKLAVLVDHTESWGYKCFPKFEGPMGFTALKIVKEDVIIK